MSTLSAFTTNLVNFFDELRTTFPEEKEIKMAYEAISGAKKINPRLLLDLFYEHVYTEFSQAIINEDIQAIIEGGRRKIQYQFNEIMPAITLFDKHWATMSEPNQTAILKYMKVLCALCKSCKGL
jgi:hypothetical protein